MASDITRWMTLETGTGGGTQVFPLPAHSKVYNLNQMWNTNSVLTASGYKLKSFKIKQRFFYRSGYTEFKIQLIVHRNRKFSADFPVIQIVFLLLFSLFFLYYKQSGCAHQNAASERMSFSWGLLLSLRDTRSKLAIETLFDKFDETIYITKM